MLRQFAADYLAGASRSAAGVAAVRLPGRAPAAVYAGRRGRPAVHRSERLAAAAAGAGTDVTLQIGEGLPHVYQLLLGTPEAARPRSKWGRSCGPGSANQTAHAEQAPRRPAHPLAAYRPASLLITLNGARPKGTTEQELSQRREKPMTGQPDSPAGLSFERDVRPMFREKDRDSMLKAFDLWSHSDVQAHQDAILERLRNGTMPCDGASPPNTSPSSGAGSPAGRRLERAPR